MEIFMMLSREKNPLYKLRKQIHLTVRGLARELGMAPMTVSYIERGRNKGLSIVMAKRIAKYFQISPYDLIKQNALWLNGIEEEKENAPQLSAKERI